MPVPAVIRVAMLRRPSPQRHARVDQPGQKRGVPLCPGEGVDLLERFGMHPAFRLAPEALREHPMMKRIAATASELHLASARKENAPAAKRDRPGLAHRGDARRRMPRRAQPHPVAGATSPGSVPTSKRNGRAYFGGNIAMASTSNSAPGRASCGTPIVVLAGGAALFTYLSRTSR